MDSFQRKRGGGKKKTRARAFRSAIVHALWSWPDPRAMAVDAQEWLAIRSVGRARATHVRSRPCPLPHKRCRQWLLLLAGVRLSGVHGLRGLARLHHLALLGLGFPNGRAAGGLADLAALALGAAVGAGGL